MPAYPGTSPSSLCNCAGCHSAHVGYDHHRRPVLGKRASAGVMRGKHHFDCREFPRISRIEQTRGERTGIQEHARRVGKGPHMFPSARLKFLQQRKQELLNASELQRRLLARECAYIQQRLEWLDRTVTTTRRILPWCSLVLPLLRLWSSQREAANKSWFGKIAAALPIAEMWNLFSRSRNGSGPVASEGEQTAPAFSRKTHA